MPASIYNIEDMEQGSTFRWDITVYNTDGETPLDLTGYSVAAQMRKNYSDAVASESFTVTYPDAINGVFRLTLSATETAALVKGRYWYDIELTDGVGVVVKLFKGYIIVTPEATKAT